MSTLAQSYTNFRFLVRSVRWVELALSALIVIFTREVSHLEFPLVPVLIALGIGFLWNTAFWYAGRRHLLLEKGPEGARLLVWCWVLSDVVLNLTLITLTGLTASPFLFLLAFPVILSTIALGRPLPCYGVAVGSSLGLGALWAMERSGTIPHFAAYGSATEARFLEPDVAAGIVMVSATMLSLVVYMVFRFRPNFFIFQESFQNGRFRVQSFRAGNLQDLRLEEVETVGPEDLLEEVVQNLTLCEDIVFGAAVVLPAGKDTIGGTAVGGWHQGLTTKRVVSTTRRQVIPTWNELNTDTSQLFANLRKGQAGDLWEGPFSVLQEDGLFPNQDDADSYLATVVSQNGRAVVVLIAGLRHPVRSRSDVMLHLLNVSAQLKPLLVAETRLSQMRGELSTLYNENEALSRANKMQSDFVSIASHELKTPLTAIGAYTDALLLHASNPDFPERSEFLSVVRQEADRLLRMVNRILDFSQIEFGNRNLNRQRVSLSDLLDDCVTTMRKQLDERDVSVELSMPGHLPRVDVDPDLMQQVFYNLLGNAEKFSPNGATIHVSAVERASTVDVSIRDEGPGIPESEVEHVFKQFYRVRDDQGEAKEGSGLGLTIVRNIINLHGGKIEVEGGQGTGATFSFTIPKEQCVNEGKETVLGEVTRRPEFNRMMKLLVRMVADYMECKIVSVMLLTADKEELFVQVAYGLEDEIVKSARSRMGEGIAGRVAQSGRAVLIENVEELDGHGIPNNPQYETNSFISVPLTMDQEVIGVINCNNKITGESFYPDDLSLLITLTDKVTMALSRAMEFEDSRDELQQTVMALQALVDLQNAQEGTTRRTVRLCMDLGRRMGLSRRQILALQYACVIHDVGMVKLDWEILRKRGPLTDEELDRIQSHPGEGIELITPFLDSAELDEVIRHHHERVDGTGYPSGLRGDHIPLSARIVAVVDAYDAMTTSRPYRPRQRPADAARELVTNAGTQFDPEVVRQFLDVLAECGEISRDDWISLKEEEHWQHPVSSS